ncbi:hypothetical protein [Nocardia sp. NPDC048505]|uniref:F0F1 ATP synthase subunit B family protein n=1 Tax=unclassified Nocardia TaxID=2637762 RepID=UPI0033EA3DBE
MHDIVWDWPIFVSQLFGFALVVYALTRWGAPRVRAAMTKAQHTIRTQLEDSERAATQVLAAAEAHESALAQAEIARAQFEADAHAAAHRILADMRAEAEEQAARTHRRAHAHLLRIRRELTDQLRADLHTAVLDRTEHTVRHHLHTPTARSTSIDQFLTDLEEVTDLSRPLPA